MNTTIKKAMSAAVASAMLLSGTACSSTEESSGEFTPKLDTETSVTLDIAGFFGNFEALDQVENDFNAFYPNVTFSYEQNGGTQISEYLDNNPYTDIFMASDDNIRFPGLEEKYTGDHCADLTGLVNESIVTENMLTTCYIDGKLLRIPMAQRITGVVVNVGLLEKEGLSVPQTWDEFTDTLGKLKDKGYTPIQGPTDVVYAGLFSAMMYNIIGNNAELPDKLYAGDMSAEEKLLPVFEELKLILDNGWTDPAINETYPADNYDQAILRFFEGEVPFWVCDTEKVSGMKKRESKSEAYIASPFEYRFIFAPTGEKGAYEYREPWYGFCVNKDSEDIEYAKEFLRFLATQPELDKIADIKGVPSITKTADAERYKYVVNVEKVQQSYTNTGAIKPHIVSFFENASKSLASGEFTTAQEAADYFIESCSTVSTTD